MLFFSVVLRFYFSEIKKKKNSTEVTGQYNMLSKGRLQKHTERLHCLKTTHTQIFTQRHGGKSLEGQRSEVSKYFFGKDQTVNTSGCGGCQFVTTAQLSTVPSPERRHRKYEHE